MQCPCCCPPAGRRIAPEKWPKGPHHALPFSRRPAAAAGVDAIVQAAAATHLPQALLAMAAATTFGPPLAKLAYNELQPKRCKECLGTGYVVCGQCQGRGKTGLSLPGEPFTVIACMQCNKRGCCKCGKCNATGLSNYWLWQPAADPGWGPRGS